MQRSCADVNSTYKRKCWTNSGGPLVNLVLWDLGPHGFGLRVCEDSLYQEGVQKSAKVKQKCKNLEYLKNLKMAPSSI